MCCATDSLDAIDADHRPIAVLDAPSNLGLRPPSPGHEPGVRHMASALRQQDVVRRLHAVDAGAVTPPPYQVAIDPATGIRNAMAIREYSLSLAERLGTMLDTRQFPVVLGGDCSILLGSALALRRRGRFGLLFVDGHSDLLTPRISKSSGAGGMDLALVTGMGPRLLTAIENNSPYFQPADVVLFGFRQPTPESGSLASPDPPMISYSLDAIRSKPIAQLAEQAVGHFKNQGFWIHLDLDVLDPVWMPAVDSPDPGGLTPDQLLTVLRTALASRACLGMELSSYDPTLDPGGRCCKLVVDLLANAFPNWITPSRTP